IVYSLDGRRKWKSTGETRQSLALNALLKFEKLLSSPTRRTLLSEFIDDFLLSATTSYSAGTKGIYKQALSKFISTIGDMSLTSVTPKHIDKYKTDRLKNLSPVTLNIELRTLRAAFYTAVRWKLLVENPFKNVPLLRVADHQPLYLSKGDFQ